MYTVEAVISQSINGVTTNKEILIHDSASPVHELHLIDPKLRIADTSAGSFTAIIPPYNPGYSLIERFTSTIKVYKEGALIWSGRVLSESIDFWNRRSISCEGALAYLNDTIQPIAYYGTSMQPSYIIRTLLEIHNQKVSNDRKIFLGVVNDFDSYYYEGYIFETNNGNTWEELNKNLFEHLKGHITISYQNGNAYLNCYKDYPNTATQQINFGENLLDFTRDWSMLDIATVILPRGTELDAETSDGQKSYITIKSEDEDHEAISDGDYAIGNTSRAITVQGQYVINNSLYSTYGRIEKVVDFNDVENSTDLFTMAKYYIYSMQFDDVTLKVNAVDLHALTDSEVSFNLLDEVYCMSTPHGMYGKYFPIVEINIPLDKPENTSYTMSSAYSNNTFTGAFNNLQSSTGSAFKTLNTTGQILNWAKADASKIINRKTTGYVNVVNMFDNDEEGIAQAIVISNNPEWKQASKYWIWNMNGLAYYSDSRSAAIESTIGTSSAYKYGEVDDTNIFESTRYYDMAITMDGTIVANHIKAGVLSDGLGYNYWNLETGEFSLQPSAKLYYGSNDDEYRSVWDILYQSDTAYNRRSGSANYLNGTKDWAEWRVSGRWYPYDDDTEIMICDRKSSVDWLDVLKSPKENIRYATIKGYKMTFSIEGVSETDWGDISEQNALVVSFSLVNSQGTRLGKMERLFSFDTDWSRRYVTIDMLDDEFIRENSGNFTNCYLDIWLYNVSKHEVSIRRLQFERGNIPTDWSVSDSDMNTSASNKANTAYNGAVSAASDLANTAASKAATYTDTRITDYDTIVTNTYIPTITSSMTEFSKKQVAGLEQSLTKKEILRRLTDDFSRNGIYMEDGELYINAEYIRSGTLDAAIVKSGTLAAQVNPLRNYWDLDRGMLVVDNAKMTNSRVDGQFTSTGPNSKIELRDGCIYGYNNNSLSSSIQTDIYNWMDEYGSISGRRGLVLNSENDMILGVRGTLQIEHSRGRFLRSVENTHTADIHIQYVSDITNYGDGNISWSYSTIHFRFVKGLLVQGTYWN